MREGKEMNLAIRYYWIFLLCVLLNCGVVSHAWAVESFKVGLVLDKGGKDDNSFNEAAVRGLERAKKELNVSAKYVEATDDLSFKPLIRSFAQKKFDYIILVGVSQADSLKNMAPQYADQHFAIIDAEVHAKNVKSLVFEEHEGSFLVGAIASLVSKTGKIGFIGGMDIPLIRRFEMGYVSGAKAARPGVRVISNYVGVTSDSWNNPAKGKELAISQYNLGADVVFAAAGASGAGLFDAAEEKKKLAIGVDLNQNGIKPGFILTSMIKRIDEGVFQIIKEAKENKFTPGIVRFGLANRGVDYAVDKNNEKLLSQDVRNQIEKLREKIISGQIKVPDYYQSTKK